MLKIARNLIAQSAAPNAAPAPATAPPKDQARPVAPDPCAPADSPKQKPSWGAVSNRLMGRLEATETGETRTLPSSVPSPFDNIPR